MGQHLGGQPNYSWRKCRQIQQIQLRPSSSSPSLPKLLECPQRSPRVSPSHVAIAATQDAPVPPVPDHSKSAAHMQTEAWLSVSVSHYWDPMSHQPLMLSRYDMIWYIMLNLSAENADWASFCGSHFRVGCKLRHWQSGGSSLHYDSVQTHNSEYIWLQLEDCIFCADSPKLRSMSLLSSQSETHIKAGSRVLHKMLW